MHPWDATRGVAYSTIGARFAARVHRFHSVVDVSGATLVPAGNASVEDLLCRLNSTQMRAIVSDLNPSVNFQLADLRRAPFFPVDAARSILNVIEESFAINELHREPSLEYRYPGPSS